jgi:hypothetical protein
LDDTSLNSLAHSVSFIHVLWLSIVAWIFSIVTVADCTFVRVGLPDADYSQLSEIGLFQYNLASDEHQCVAYSNTINFSAAVKTARAFGVLCCILTSLVMLQALGLLLVYQNMRELVWKSVRLLVIAAPLAQVLTFTAFADDQCNTSNQKCVPGTAGIFAVFNVVVLIVLAGVTWFATPPEQPLYEIKRLETPPAADVPEEKPTTIEDIESDGGHSIEAHPEQAIATKSNRDVSASAELDEVVKAVDVDEPTYPVKSVRPVSPDSEKRRLSFSPKPSPRSSKRNDDDSPRNSRLEVSRVSAVAALAYASEGFNV